MFLHILGSGSMFTYEFYKMISSYFPKEEHVFLGSYPDKELYDKMDGCTIVQSRSLKMPIYLYKADHIIVHGYFNKTVILMLSLQPWLLKKCNWIIFGRDIYIHDKVNKNFEERFFEFLVKCSAPKFSFISTFSDGDWEYAQKWYGVKGKHMVVSYPVAGGNTDLVKELHCQKKSGCSVNIIVGNSATETNQHFEALDLLSRFKTQNIKVYLPLNYGGKDYELYADKVINYAISIFGTEKVVPLRKKLSGEEYLRYLNMMDVGIFNNNRQQAMGNISQLLLCGAKVYIRHDTSMWDHFESFGAVLHDIASIYDYSNLEQLVSEDDEMKIHNYRVISGRHDTERKIKLWDDVFDSMAL